MLYDQIQESLAYLRTQTDFQPEYGIILGTGLGNLTQHIEIEAEIEYKDIPHFPVSTVESHQGKLIFGTFAGRRIVAMAGRFHYYEGYTMQQVTFPIRVMKALNIKQLFISNASGSTNADIAAGDIVFVRDHINLQPANPLRGENDERLGPRFPDMLRTYDIELTVIDANGCENDATIEISVNPLPSVMIKSLVLDILLAMLMRSDDTIRIIYLEESLIILNIVYNFYESKV